MNECEDNPTWLVKPENARTSILCVDTSPEMLEICRSILEADGYQVFTTRSPADALQLLRLHPVDVVVVDDSLPGMSGIALAEKIKLSARNVLVVMYSAEWDKDEGLPFVDSLLYKGRGPIALRTLLATLLQK